MNDDDVSSGAEPGASLGQAPWGFEGLGRVLRYRRMELELTQAALAERAGVAAGMLSRYEAGRQRPQLATLARLLGALELPLAELAIRLEWARAATRGPADRRGSRRLPDRAGGAAASGEPPPQWPYPLVLLLELVEEAAERAAEPELARALSHLRLLWAVGAAATAEGRLRDPADEVRAAARAAPWERSEPERGEP